MMLNLRLIKCLTRVYKLKFVCNTDSVVLAKGLTYGSYCPCGLYNCFLYLGRVDLECSFDDAKTALVDELQRNLLFALVDGSVYFRI